MLLTNLVFVYLNDMACLVRFGQHTLKKLVGWLEKNTSIEKDFTILDIGCGNGVTLIEMVKQTNLGYIG